jgi:hypothetical protein
MGESKSSRFLNDFNARSEKQAIFHLCNFNRLAGVSEWVRVNLVSRYIITDRGIAP